MASYNRVIVMGNLTRDPEYKQLSSGQSVCRLGLASNRQFKNRQTGMMVQEVCFVDIDVWGAQAESCNQYLQKGRGVLVEGRLKLDTWVDNEGQRRSKHSIVADRVTFMPSASTQDGAEFDSFAPVSGDLSGDASEPEKVDAGAMEMPAVDAKSEAKKATTAKKTKKTSTGEVDFNDQEPFEDDLPF